MLKIKKDRMKDLENYSVYEHLFPNGKKYIGITSKPPKLRWANGKGYNHNALMKRAINKYGWDKIRHTILFSSISKAEAERIEIELIKKYNTTNICYGYNIDNGGNSLGKHSEQSIQKMRDYANNRPQTHNEKISKSKKGKPQNLTDEQRDKKREIMLGNCYGKNSKSMLGKHHTLETRNKISASNIGKPSWNKGKNRTMQHTINNANAHKKVVLQFDLNMVFINEYPSVKEAMLETKISSIGKACRNIQRTAGGYVWKYKIKADMVEKECEE